MSDFGSSMMPSYWYGGNPNAGFQNNLAQNQAALANNQNFYAGLANVGAQNQASLNNAYGPMGFGGATAQAAYAGAAAGRNTGGFNAIGGVQQQVAPAYGQTIADFNAGRSGGSVFNTGTSPVPYSPPPGSFSPSPNYTGGRSVFDTGTSPIGGGSTGVWPGGGVGSFLPTQGYQNPFNTPMGGSRNIPQAFSDVAPQNQSALNAVNQFAGRGTGVAPDQPYSLPPPLNPFEHAFGSLPEGGGFADRFGFRNAGTPSEYTTSPYTSAQGTTFQPGQMPPGFSTPFGADNPGGALTRQMRGGIGQQAPIMNESWDPGESGDTLTPHDRTAPGGFYGSAFNPAQYQHMLGSTFDPSGYGGIGSDMLRGGQNQPYAQPWHSLIPGGTPNTPEIIKQINYTAGRGRYDPAAFANVIDTESKWDPTTHNDKYFGATQMGADTFREAGGRLGGMNFGQYQKAPLEQQIPAYGDWLQYYAQPGNAAGLATSDIRGLPVPMQSAILQGTQFSPNAGLPGTVDWPGALAQGNMNVSTSPNNPRTGRPYDQAERLGVPPTINSMDTYYGRR